MAIAARPSPEPAWHALEPARAVSILASQDGGLTEDEVSRRLAEVGPNLIEKARPPGLWVLLGRQVNNPIMFLLLGAAVLAAVMGKLLDAAVVLGAIVVNVLIGLVQEQRAGQAIEALGQMVPSDTRVLRAGAQRTVPAVDLVPGDVVVLASGDRVPADLRLLGVRNLRVDESALTGESLAVEKVVRAVDSEATLGDRRSMAFGGTLVTAGTATGIVVATGSATELGRISRMLEAVTELETPLTRAIRSVGRVLTIAVLVAATALFVASLARGWSAADGALAAITLAVATIPEGLPAIITIALAIGVQRMAARRAIVRKLPSVETLGSTTVICTDKTGTLTRNEMTVQHLTTRRDSYAVSGVGYAPLGAVSPEASVGRAAVPDDVRELVEAGVLCSDASVHLRDDAWAAVGDPTEAALVVVAMKAGVDVETLRARWPRLDVVPFESEHQFMATLHAAPDGGRVIVLKGAPEVVLRCARLTADERAFALALVGELSARGTRVLAIGRKRAPDGTSALDPASVEGGFELLGFEGMIDPPRPEAIAAIARCHDAGITVKMITGDHVRTAVAIGEQLGLLAPGEPGLSGHELEARDDRELEHTAASVHVFARVSPEHKLRLVRALQRSGHVVAMTGDGVNDAPALRQANVGVAMGGAGTEVAKEAADIVLADDNFATIAAAVEEGRRIYDNLVKSLAFVLPTNLGLGLILVVAVATFPLLEIGGERVPLVPMLPTQMLWINLVASVTLSLPLAFEVIEPDAMRRPPRAPHSPILGRFVIGRTVLVALLMCAGGVGTFLWEYGTEVGRRGHLTALREAQTIAVTTVVMFQAFYLFNCRSLRTSLFGLAPFSNPSVFVGIGVLLALQACFVYVPWMNTIFGTTPVQPEALGLAAVVAFTVLPIIELEKWLARWRARRAEAPPTHGPTEHRRRRRVDHDVSVAS